MEWNKPKLSQVYNTSGLKKGRGWNKGISNLEASKRMKGSNNPNWEGRLNKKRYENRVVDDEWQRYKEAVRRATYRSWYKMRNEGKIPSNTGKKSHNLQLDHIIPKKQGYELGIDPEIIGSEKNLQYILAKDNRKKWDKFQPQHIVEEITNGVQRQVTRSL